MDIKIRDKKSSNPKRKHKTKTVQKVWIGSYIFLLLVFIAAYFLLRMEVFVVFGKYRTLLQKLAAGGIFTVIILTSIKVSELIINSKTHTRSIRYNLIRFVRLVGALVIISILVSILFVNWYTAAVSLGLISLVLGFALQTPISSFISWLYIVIRSPYRVGDRIQVNDFTGDVVEINYLDTTLWEFAGDYLTNDLPSGRLIRFPNSLVFQYPVYNYSWEKFPYIWNELPFHIAYESDLTFVETTIRRVAREELGPGMEQHVQDYKKLLSQTAIDELEIKEYPFITFRTNTNTWIEALLTYLVDPKKASATRSQLLKKIVAALLEEPDKVMFPKSNAR